MAPTVERLKCVSCEDIDRKLHNNKNICIWKHNGKKFRRCMNPSCTENITICLDKEVDNNVSTIKIQKEIQPLLTGEYKEYRGLSIATCKRLGIHMKGNQVIFNYGTGQKVRFPKMDGNKGMFWLNYEDTLPLFGENVEYDYSKEIVLTEGEFDAASVVEAGYQAYSIGTGAEGGDREIKAKIALIAQFKRVILWFDKDAAGQGLTKRVMELPGFPLEKTAIVKCDKYKDANECLTEQVNREEIKAYINNALHYMPEGVVHGSQIDFSLLSRPEEPGITFAFSGMQNALHGLRAGEVLLLGGGSGSGKSSITKQLLLFWITTAPTLRVTSLFLEEEYIVTLKSLTALHHKLPTHVVREGGMKDLEDKARDLLGHDRLIFDKFFGSLDSRKLFSKLRILAHRSDVIVLDHISIIVSGMSSVEGERRDIDRIMTYIKTLAVETGCRFIIISHLRRPSGEKSYEQGLEISENSFRGSHSLYQLSDSVVGIERDQRSEFDGNKINVRVLKNRYKGSSGIVDSLFYDEETGCLQDLQDIFN